MAAVKVMIEEIIEVASEVCTEWEYDFMESISEQYEERGELTSKQESILKRIYEKACAGPH